MCQIKLTTLSFSVHVKLCYRIVSTWFDHVTSHYNNIVTTTTTV